MNSNKEKQLEQVAERAVKNAEKMNLAPPIFELYAALLSMSLSIIMFLFPELLEGRGGFYEMMTAVMAQGGWALMFFVAGVSGAAGMLINLTRLRVFALVMMTLLYGILTIIYGTLLPNFGFVVMVWTTIFTFASIPLVKYTGIWQKREKGNKKHDTKTH